ncbi:unnamed protein product [Sphacelaria rigidula]
MLLVATYFMLLQRRYSQHLQELCIDEVIGHWRSPTQEMHAAAKTVQACFRNHFATIKVIRAREFHMWRYRCTRTHRVAENMVHAAIALTIVGLTYANLVFAAKFDSTTSTTWLATWMVAILVEAFLQQPVLLLATGVLGDFVETGVEILIEMVG